MRELYRLIDANINRAAEGLRVLEDLARFYYNNKTITERIKELRHTIRKTVNNLYNDLIQERDSSTDIGLAISQQTDWDQKSNLKELLLGNFKRVEEGLRVVEESLKVVGYYQYSKVYEACRYQIYSLEKDYLLGVKKLLKKETLSTDLYCLTAEEHSLGRSNLEVVSQMIEAGIKVIQYREKEKKMLYKYEECQRIRQMTKDADVTFIINDDLELALLVGADGIHIGQEDLPIEKVRQLVGEEMIIGLSTHSPKQAEEAVARGADYIGVGPIFRTFTKKDVCDPVGLEYLDYVVKKVDIPFVAIGGIKESNILEVAKRGAKTIAMVTEIVGAEDIPGKIANIRRKIADELYYSDGCC